HALDRQREQRRADLEGQQPVLGVAARAALPPLLVSKRRSTSRSSSARPVSDWLDPTIRFIESSWLCEVTATPSIASALRDATRLISCIDSTIRRTSIDWVSAPSRISSAR